jgi:hypothetical protein
MSANQTRTHETADAASQSIGKVNDLVDRSSAKPVMIHHSPRRERLLANLELRFDQQNHVGFRGRCDDLFQNQSQRYERKVGDD